MLWLWDVYGGRSFISGPGGCDKSCPQAEVGGPTAVRAAFLEAKLCTESVATPQDSMFVLGIGCGMAGMCLLTRNGYLTCFMRTVVI